MPAPTPTPRHLAQLISFDKPAYETAMTPADLIKRMESVTMHGNDVFVDARLTPRR